MKILSVSYRLPGAVVRNALLFGGASYSSSYQTTRSAVQCIIDWQDPNENRNLLPAAIENKFIFTRKEERFFFYKKRFLLGGWIVFFTSCEFDVEKSPLCNGSLKIEARHRTRHVINVPRLACQARHLRNEEIPVRKASIL